MLIPIILVLMLKLVNNRKIMGNWINSRLGNVLAGGMTLFIALATVVMLATSLCNARAGRFPPLSGPRLFYR